MTVTDEQIAELLQDPVAQHDFVVSLGVHSQLGTAWDPVAWYEKYQQGVRIDPEYGRYVNEST